MSVSTGSWASSVSIESSLSLHRSLAWFSTSVSPGYFEPDSVSTAYTSSRCGSAQSMTGTCPTQPAGISAVQITRLQRGHVALHGAGRSRLVVLPGGDDPDGQ